MVSTPAEKLQAGLEATIDGYLAEALPSARLSNIRPVVHQLLSHIFQRLSERLAAADFYSLTEQLVHLLTKTLYLHRRSPADPLPRHPAFDDSKVPPPDTKLPFVHPAYLRALLRVVLSSVLSSDDLVSPVLSSFLLDAVLYFGLSGIFSLAHPENSKVLVSQLVANILRPSPEDNSRSTLQPDAGSTDFVIPLLDLFEPLLNARDRPRLATLITFSRLLSLIPYSRPFVNKQIHFLIHQAFLSSDAQDNLVTQLLLQVENHSPTTHDQSSKEEWSTTISYKEVEEAEQELITNLAQLIDTYVPASILAFYFPDLSSNPSVSFSLAIELASLLDDHALNTHMILHALDIIAAFLFPEISISS